MIIHLHPWNMLQVSNILYTYILWSSTIQFRDNTNTKKETTNFPSSGIDSFPTAAFFHPKGDLSGLTLVIYILILRWMTAQHFRGAASEASRQAEICGGKLKLRRRSVSRNRSWWLWRSLELQIARCPRILSLLLVWLCVTVCVIRLARSREQRFCASTPWILVLRSSDCTVCVGMTKSRVATRHWSSIRRWELWCG